MIKKQKVFAHIINDKKLTTRTLLECLRERWQEIRAAR